MGGGGFEMRLSGRVNPESCDYKDGRYCDHEKVGGKCVGYSSDCVWWECTSNRGL